MQRKKIMYLEVARILGAFAVILVHIANLKPNWTTIPCDTDVWQILCNFGSITKWAAPIFCMVSGALFLDPDRNVTIKKLYTRNIPRMAISFLFWSGGYVALKLFFLNYEMTTAETIKTLVGGNYHQWYIYMTIGFYILVPLIRKITEDKKSTQYIIGLCFVFTYLIPFLQTHEKLDWTASATNLMFIELPGYLIYFLVGYYINKYDINKISKILLYVLGILSFFITVKYTADISAETGKYYAMLSKYFSITVLLQTIFVFVLIKDIFEKVSLGKKSEKLVLTLSKDTFGVYQVHAAIIVLVTHLTGFNTAGFKNAAEAPLFQLLSNLTGFDATAISNLAVTPLIAVPLLFITTYLISEAISHILNKIPVINKYIV